MKTKISGTFTAIVTPFNYDGSVNEKGLRENIRYQIENGIDGIVVLGSTGEAPTLTHTEKLRIMQTSLQEAKGKIHVMVGTGSYSTQQTIENTLEAEHAGADSVLVVTPYYNKPTQEGLYQHYAALAKATRLPIVVYNVEGRTGRNLETATLKRLAEIPNIVGVKEASGNLMQMMDVIESILPFRPDFSVMSGDDALAYPLIALGGHGIYSVLSNLYPDHMKKLTDAALNGYFVEAKEMHYALLPLMRNLFIETNPIPVKAAMNHLGMAAGTCRLPLCEMTKNNFEKIKPLLEIFITSALK